jgi:hypothetical protein
LNPNKLRWVRDDEAYAPIRFEAIPSTLNFEQNLIPWIIVDFSTGRKAIGRKWVFKKNLNVEGKVEKYKSRLVAKGYS